MKQILAVLAMLAATNSWAGKVIEFPDTEQGHRECRVLSNELTSSNIFDQKSIGGVTYYPLRSKVNEFDYVRTNCDGYAYNIVNRPFPDFKPKRMTVELLTRSEVTAIEADYQLERDIRRAQRSRDSQEILKRHGL